MFDLKTNPTSIAYLFKGVTKIIGRGSSLGLEWLLEHLLRYLLEYLLEYLLQHLSTRLNRLTYACQYKSTVKQIGQRAYFPTFGRGFFFEDVYQI